MKARKLIAMLLVVATLMSFAPMAVFAAEGDTYVVDVQYVYAGGPLDGEYVATPWSGSYAHGSGDNRTITVPTAQGYTAQLGAVTSGVTASLDGKELTFSFENLSGEKTILVEYVPAEVGMTVEFYQESLVEGAEDDLVETVTIEQAKTGDNIADYVSYTDGKIIVEGAEKKYAGFYGLWFDNTDTVAADGNTKVKVYFDREYYLLSFDLGGGYGVDPQFLRFGETPAAVGEPTRPGYTFKGWDVEVPKNMPANNLQLTAQWEEVETAPITVVYWGENANDENYSYITSVQVDVATGTVVGGNGLGFCGQMAHVHGDDCLTCTTAEHTHSADCCTVEEHEHSSACCDKSHSHYYNCNTNKCGNQTEHTHGDGNCTCATSEHTHADGCYSCGVTGHIHTNACMDHNVTTADGTALSNTALWTYVKGDTATVEPDGTTVINFYFDRTYFTMTFKEEGSNGDTLGTIYDKWGADIKTRFENVSKANTFFWSMKQNGGSPWTSFMDVMPTENRTYYADPQSGSTQLSAYYKVQNLAGTAYETLYTVSFKGSSSITVTEEEFVEIEGFTFNDSQSTDIGKTYNGAVFCYDRNSYDLVYVSGGVEVNKVSVKYEASLAGKDDYEPASVPSYLEAGAYVFGGWYANPECTEEFDFDNTKMPAKTVSVYAKWVPVTHDVTVYLDADAAKAGTDPISAQTVSHRDFATEPQNVSNEPYAFVAWFYVDENGNEKAFDFGSMQITRDTVVYAKWKATNPVAYTVKFVLANEDGTASTTEVAAPINGMALPFTTVTEEAKVGEELYAAYQEGYFPNIASQSIVISGTGVNEIIFIYAPAENVPYTVRYLEEGTGNVLKEEKVVSDNKKSVVTETAAFINGYMADAYQKRLVLTTGEGAENVITFYYTADTENTLVIVEHILDDRNFQYDFSQTPEKKGTVITASAKTIGGYVFDHVDIYYLDGTVIRENVTDTTVTETLDLKGLHIVFHYIPNEFYVHHQSDGSVETYKLPEHEAFDVTGVVYDSYLYGGLYDSTFTTPYTSATLAKAYKNAPVDGMNLKPVAGEHYYVKEVDDRYARPGLYLISHTRSQQNYKMLNLYLLTAIDDGNYLEVGVELNGVEHSISSSTNNLGTNTDNTAEETNNWNVLHSVFTVNFEASPGKDAYTDNVTANSLFKVGEGKGYLYAYDYSAYIANPEKVTYSCFFVTPDGVRVEGVKYRDLYKDSTIDGVDILTKNNFVRTASAEIPSVCTSKNTASGTNAVEFAPLMTRSTLAVSARIVDTYTITSVNGSTTSVQEVEAGDQTGSIAYTEKPGYVFAGWYTNKACTKPADFSNVQSDMTVYPKYISVKNVTSKVMPLGKFMNVSVSVPNSDLAQVGVSYTVDGETTNVVCKKSQNLIVGLKKLLGSKATTYTASWSMSGLSNGDTFSVTTYWVTADGTMVEIQTTDYAYSRNRISVQ